MTLKLYRVTIKALFIICFLLIINQSFSQEVYSTRLGNLTLVSIFNHQSINAHSKKLEVELDYENAIFKMKLPISSIHTGIDSIDQKLHILENTEFFNLNGQLGIKYINTKYHRPQHFEFQGTLEYKLKVIEIKGEGHLQHIEGGETFSCLLGIQFEFEPEKIGLDIIQENVRVNIRQTILSK